MISNSDGQRRCSCKKSKCLKLYCDCFAAGFYCDESCSCQGCLNKLDYEDTVEETRSQIKSRNPLAFSSKIHGLTQSPASQIVVPCSPEDVDPIAGKHIKGCNCKKSMCTKRYCECCQAKVGCSSECRCEGCKNVFGIREGYNAYNELTTGTPFRHTGHKEDVSTPTTNKFNIGCYIPSPGSANSNSEMILGTSNDNFDAVVHSDVEFMNQFTPFMDWQNSSRVNGGSSSVNSLQWPGSLNLVNRPVPLRFGGPIVNEFKDNHIETIHDME